jgi:mannose-6-phosphate isomerase
MFGYDFMGYLSFMPIYQERVWGGRNLETELQRDLPEGVIGESWEMVDRPEANSVVASGPHAGKSLRTLLEEDCEAILGPGRDPHQPFPILVKWLDCEERLSLQVHPPKDIAPGLGGEPKTENWYIAGCRPGARLLAGLMPGVTRDDFAKALEANDLEPLVCALETSEGDSLFVPSGRIHAIDGGNLILEIQQNSDTTYRVYDWGRTGLDGKPRTLHIEESLASIEFNDVAPELKRSDEPSLVLVDDEVFHLERRHLEGGEVIEFPAGQSPVILSVVAGSLRAGGDLITRGANLLLPYAEDHRFMAEGATTVLVTSRF